MMTNKLSLVSLLNQLDDEYVLIKKWVDFPAYSPGSDMDVLVMDRLHSSLILQEYLRENIAEDTYLRVKEGEKHVHLDLMHRDRIWFRVDLIDNFDFYGRFSIQDSLRIKIFAYRKIINIENSSIFVPSDEHDLLLRYFEYLEWFEQRPDKIKHLDYILANSTRDQQQNLIANAHRFIRYEHSYWGEINTISRTEITSRKGALKEIYRLAKYIYTRTFHFRKI